MLEITLTFAEEKLGLSYADLSLCWSDLHLDGGWERKEERVGLRVAARGMVTKEQSATRKGS